MNEMENNVFDKLLYYLSHESELSWEKFKDAIDRLTDNQSRFEYPATYLKPLGRLGHLDFDPMPLSRIVVTPTALVETAVENHYVLVGSRTPDFLMNIKKCVSDTGGNFEVISEQYGPTTIMLSGLTEASFAEIESLGIHISLAFSAKLSDVLPSPKYSSFPRSETAFPGRFGKFNLSTLEYDKRSNNLRINNGLYEIPRYGPDVYILKSGAFQRRVPRDWGEWLTLSMFGRKTGFISYKESSQTWRVRRTLHVPLIVDRCATLCSGYPPKLIGNFVCYSDVPVGIAYRLTKSLYQDWEVV